MRAVYYLNQFFGQIGGEEAADHPTEIQRGAVGAAGAFQKRFSEEELEVAFTIICGTLFCGAYRRSFGRSKTILREGETGSINRRAGF